MTDKQQSDLTVSVKDTEDIGDIIVRELCPKHVNWFSIANLLVKSIDNTTIPSQHKCAFLCTIEVARLGEQLSDTNDRLDRIEKTLKRLVAKSIR